MSEVLNWNIFESGLRSALAGSIAPPADPAKQYTVSPDGGKVMDQSRQTTAAVTPAGAAGLLANPWVIGGLAVAALVVGVVLLRR